MFRLGCGRATAGTVGLWAQQRVLPDAALDLRTWKGAACFISCSDCVCFVCLFGKVGCGMDFALGHTWVETEFALSSCGTSATWLRHGYITPIMSLYFQVFISSYIKRDIITSYKDRVLDDSLRGKGMLYCLVL